MRINARGGGTMEEQKPEQTQDAAPKAPSQEPKPSVKPEPPVSGPLAQFEAWLYDTLVVKAPYQLPKAAKDWIVQYGPWITLVLGIILVVTVLPALTAAMTATSVLGGMYGALVVASVGPMFYLSLAVLAVQLVIMFMSVPMLLKRQRKGWLLVFYSSVVSLVYSVVNTFSYGTFGVGSLIGGLIGAAIGMYFIFQIRSYYKN